MDWWKEKFINRRDYMLDHLDELTMTSDETLFKSTPNSGHSRYFGKKDEKG